MYLAPDRPAHVTSLAVTTNHQGTVEWAPYAAAIRTVERHEHREELVTSGADVPTSSRPACSHRCTPPRFGAGFGTLYTAEHRPAEGTARYHWPHHTEPPAIGPAREVHLHLNVSLDQLAAIMRHYTEE